MHTTATFFFPFPTPLVGSVHFRDSVAPAINCYLSLLVFLNALIFPDRNNYRSVDTPGPVVFGVTKAAVFLIRQGVSWPARVKWLVR